MNQAPLRRLFTGLRSGYFLAAFSGKTALAGGGQNSGHEQGHTHCARRDGRRSRPAGRRARGGDRARAPSRRALPAVRRARTRSRRCSQQHPKLAERSTVRHCEVAIKMTDKPSQALRTGRRTSSMWQAIEAVKNGEADCAVSAGNTGALMAMAKFCLHMLPMIERPAIAAMWPTLRGEFDRARRRRDDRRRRAPPGRSRDHGRGDGAHPVRHRKADRRPAQRRRRGDQGHRGGQGGRPHAARDRVRPTSLYHGFVEGDDLGKGTVDVIVTEGFTGNIALKTAEGTAKQIAQYMRDAMSHSLMTRLGYWFARDGFRPAAREDGPRPSQRRRVPRP